MIKRFEVFGVLLALPMVIAGAAFAEPTTPATGTLPVAVQEPGGGWKKLTLVPAEGNAYWLVGDDGNRVELLQSQVGKHPLPGHLELVGKNYYGHLSLKESGQFPLSTRAMLQFTGKLEDAPQHDAKEELGVLRAGRCPKSSLRPLRQLSWRPWPWRESQKIHRHGVRGPGSTCNRVTLPRHVKTRQRVWR